MSCERVGCHIAEHGCEPGCIVCVDAEGDRRCVLRERRTLQMEICRKCRKRVMCLAYRGKAKDGGRERTPYVPMGCEIVEDGVGPGNLHAGREGDR